MMLIFRDSGYVENIPSDIIFFAGDHFLFYAPVDNIVLSKFIPDKMTQVNELSSPKQSIEGSMLFKIYSAILWIYYRFYLKLLYFSINFSNWLMVQYSLQ